MARIILLFIALAWGATSYGQQELEIIPLRHQTPDRVLPALQPLVEPGGSLSAGNNQLFLRASRRNREDIKRALAALDAPVRKLVIRVSQTPEAADVDLGAEGVDGSDVDERRDRHAAQRGDDGDDRLGRAAQRPEDELVLELEADDEEEHREQAVGRPDRQRQVQVQRLGADRRGREGVVRLPPRGVRPHQREDRRAEQQDAAHGLLPQRVQEVRPLGQRQPLEQRVVRHPTSRADAGSAFHIAPPDPYRRPIPPPRPG